MAEGSLHADGLQTLGKRARYTGGAGWSGLVRDLDSTIGVNETATLYLSFLMNPERDQASRWGGVGFIGVNHGTAPWAGFADGQYAMRNFDGGGKQPSPAPAVLNDTALLVVRADFTPGSDKFTLYVDPPLGNPEPRTGIVKTDVGMPGLGSIYIAGGLQQGFSVDEIRLDETYLDVRPTLDALYVGGESTVGTYEVTGGDSGESLHSGPKRRRISVAAA